MLLLVVSLLVAGAVAPALGDALGRRAFWLLALVPVAGLAWLVGVGGGVIDGAVRTESWSWVPDLGLDLAFRLDGIALLMAGLVTGIGALVMVYAGGYLGDSPGSGRFAALLLAFTAAMVGLVTADNILLLFVFWEGTTVVSYLLVGYEDRRPEVRGAALQALLITAAGGLALLGGLVILGTEAGTFSLTEIAGSTFDGGPATAAAVLVLLGAFTKSAQVPFHGWLPGAMAAPTPASAFLHSATMVKAGVYLVAVMAPALSATTVWMPAVVVVGTATACWGGYQSLRQDDGKRLLAYSTISVLGLLVVLLGIDEPKATFAGIAFLVAHALYKASLFMVVGVVDHEAGTRLLSRLNGLGRRLPVVAVAGVVAAASMAGLPPLFGFVAKELAIAATLGASAAKVGALVAVVAAGVLGVTAAVKFAVGTFGDDGRGAAEPESVHSPSAAFVAAPLVLAAISLVAGLAAGPLTPLVASAAGSVDPAAADYEMKLWPGLVLALGVSAGVIVAGFLLWWARSPLAAVQTRLAVGPSASRVFEELVELLLRMAKATARWSQSGSLPAYLAIILVTLVALPALPVVMASAWPSEIDVAELPSQLAVVVLLVTAAVALAFVRRRFAGAMLLGAVGYSMSILFVIQGAPDLALTQVLVETISVVAFLLVMRRLPADFPAEPFRLVKAGRGAVAVAVGVGFAAFLVTALAGQVSEGPRAEMIEQAAPQAKGENVVNVILTDVRALDTLGEITVLVVAAVGIAALAGPRRRLGPVPTLRPSPVQLAVLRLITPLLGLAAAVLFFVGHDLPGGGFIAGLLVGTIPVLRWLSAREPAASWIQPHRLLGAGLLVAMAAGLLGWIVGGAFLQGLTHQVSFGPISYKLTSASLFDLGVLLVVVGLVLAVLEYLGRDAAVDLAPGGGPAHPDVAVGGSRALPVAVPGEGA